MSDSLGAWARYYLTSRGWETADGTLGVRADPDNGRKGPSLFHTIALHCFKLLAGLIHIRTALSTHTHEGFLMCFLSPCKTHVPLAPPAPLQTPLLTPSYPSQVMWRATLPSSSRENEGPVRLEATSRDGSLVFALCPPFLYALHANTGQVRQPSPASAFSLNLHCLYSSTCTALVILSHSLFPHPALLEEIGAHSI
jgi:outer membrane protein assembly factor BamB